jgi:hypothetical protein
VLGTAVLGTAVAAGGGGVPGARAVFDVRGGAALLPQAPSAVQSAAKMMSVKLLFEACGTFRGAGTAM